MTIAIKYGSLVDEPLVDDDGNFAIKGSGGALVERLLKIFPGSCLVGYQDQRANGFEIKRVTSLDPVSDLVINLCKDPELMPAPEGIAAALKEPLLKVFPPALLGRLVVIPYYPLSPDAMAQIVRLQLNRIKKRVEANHQVPFQYTDAVVNQVLARCNDAESGGRIVDAISLEYLSRLAAGGEIRRVALDIDNDDFTYDFD